MVDSSKSGRLKRRGGRLFFLFWGFFKAPDALPASILMPYGGSRLFRRSNYEDKKSKMATARDGVPHKHIRACIHTWKCGQSCTCFLIHPPNPWELNELELALC